MSRITLKSLAADVASLRTSLVTLQNTVIDETFDLDNPGTPHLAARVKALEDHAQALEAVLHSIQTSLTRIPAPATPPAPRTDTEREARRAAMARSKAQALATGKTVKTQF